MFEPTHWLISRTRKVPVIVQAQGDKSLVFTEAEWGQTDAPAFEFYARIGMYCRGIQVLGYTLEPVSAAVSSMPSCREAS